MLNLSRASVPTPPGSRYLSRSRSVDENTKPLIVCVDGLGATDHRVKFTGFWVSFCDPSPPGGGGGGGGGYMVYHNSCPRTPIRCLPGLYSLSPGLGLQQEAFVSGSFSDQLTAAHLAQWRDAMDCTCKSETRFNRGC